ncbi:MAG: hypothetical protein BroJett011_52890 [Chloroflexota bacterium]|nr:MAG: hypothetical protein BroJett011_52890 [Chloroflexota bacterium]
MLSAQNLSRVCIALAAGLGAVLIVSASLASGLAQSTELPNLITREGRFLVRNGARFEVRGMNYYPKDFAWDKFWTNYSNPATSAQINQELDKAKLLGINTVRIFTPYRSFSGTVQSDYPSYLVDFIHRLQTHDMVAIVTLFDLYASDSTAPYSTTDYLSSTRHISTVVNILGKTNPAILAWDLKNELDRDYGLGQAQVKAWANEMINQTRQLDPNHLITIGFYGAVTGTLCYDSGVTTQVYSPTIAAEFAPSVDFVSMHYFLSERCFESDLQALQSLIGNKPLVLEEFGLHTLSNPVLANPPHTEIQQAAYYNALLSLSEANGVAGYLFWTLNDFSYILSGSPEFERCLGILRNSQVSVCQVTNPADYSEKLAAGTTRRHYEAHIAYLDLFDAWPDPNTDVPPAGWADNWADGGALLRGYKPTHPLWSHNPGKVAFSKFVTNSTSITGLAVSPILMDVDVGRYSFLTGQVSNYSIRDATFGSNATLYIGVKEGAQVTRLLTITPGLLLPYIFHLNLSQPPTRWSGIHNFQIVLELVPEAGKDGYSAAYEFEWIAVQGHVVYLPLILKRATP